MKELKRLVKVYGDIKVYDLIIILDGIKDKMMCATCDYQCPDCTEDICQSVNSVEKEPCECYYPFELRILNNLRRL